MTKTELLGTIKSHRSSEIIQVILYIIHFEKYIKTKKGQTLIDKIKESRIAQILILKVLTIIAVFGNIHFS